MSEIKNILLQNKINNLLEIGCGCGNYINKFTNLVENIVGLDESKEMLQHVDKKISIINKNILTFPNIETKFEAQFVN